MKRVFWVGLIGIFLLAFFMRLSRPASKYTVWYERSAAFWGALMDGDLSDTYQSHHPGVTTMWIAGSGMELYLAANGRPASDIVDLPEELPSPQSAPVRAGVAALALAIACCTAAAYATLHRVTGWTTALGAGCLLALDPFHLTHSKMIHLDGLLSSLMLLSALLLIAYLKLRSPRYLAGSAIVGGLACLTKSPALFLIPYVGLITTIHAVTGDGVAALADVGNRRRCLLRIVRTLAVWCLIAASVFCILWPAVWVQPSRTVSDVLVQGALHHAEQSHPFPQFFLGRNVRDPGLLYYPVIFGWKTTLITLPAIGSAILFLFRGSQNGDRQTQRDLWIYVLAFVVQMTLSAKKISRYVLPVFLALDVIAAWGLVRTVKALAEWRRWEATSAGRTAAISGALLVHLVAILRVHPYFGTHHNLLLGGSRAARRALQLGDQGEGLDLAAAFLNSQPGAGYLTVGICDHGNLMFRENFTGVTKPINHTDVDYRVFYVNDLQRAVRFAHCEEYWTVCQEKRPIWSTSFDGVPYVWICRAYPYDLEPFNVDRRLDVHVGDHVNLLGYTLSSAELTSSAPLTVTLFWQSDGAVTSDHHVFVHLLDGSGELVAQHDGVPGAGERPTWGWQREEVVSDEHVLGPLRAAPAGTYELSVGMYDYGTKNRLPVTGADGSQLPAGRIPLHTIELRHP